MADNLFTDFPDRVDQMKKYSDLLALAPALEEAHGDKDTFKSPQEALDFYLGALEEIGRYCAKEMLPAAAAIGREGARFENGEVILPAKLNEHIKRCAELGVFQGPIARANGGLNLPRGVQMMAMEMFAHACPNTALTIACYSMGDFLQLFGTEAQKTKYLPKLNSAEWTTSMALTEPGAGSDLGKLRATGHRDGDKWIVNGTKQFITGGHGDITFALVRTDPKSSGLNGLSVILVPRRIDGKLNFRVTKIEEKVCLHASPTCALLFENSVGEMFGTEGQGFKVMAELMNGARLAMGALSAGISVAAVEEAKKYGRERSTMGKPILQHPMIADMLYEAEVETRAMRSLVMEAAASYDWMHISAAKKDDASFKKWKKRYRRLTPLCKYFGSEKAITIARNGLQIFGGYGVCREYPAERLWRETIIYPIYEGTSQIQSLMVLKDTLRDVAQMAGGFLGSLAGAWAESLVVRDPVKAKVLEGRNELNQGIKTILMSILKDKFKQDISALGSSPIQGFLKEFSTKLVSEKTDLTYPFLCAERFTRITCDYYAMKCMADRIPAGDEARVRQVLEFAALAIPRMRLENEYMVNRLPATLAYMKTLE